MVRRDPLAAFHASQKKRVHEAMVAQDCVTLEKAKTKVHYQLWNLMAKQPEANMVEWGLSGELRYPVFSLLWKEETTGGRFRVTVSTVKGEVTFEMHGSMPLRRTV